MTIYRFETIDSTMFEASRLADAGAPSGTTVVAEEQTAGHGRHGRRWHSEPRAGLYLSVILRFPFAPETLPLVTLALGLAVVEAIHETTGIVCDLRWPNDVLAGDRKCAGILTQLEGTAVIAGIGINVNHTAFPPDLSAIATSLRIAGGHEYSREDLLQALLPAIDSYCDLLAREGKDPILDMFSNASSYVRGRRVTIDDKIEGMTAGLNESGFLLLRDDAGKQHTILAGGVRPCS
jgi:BirA family biotin operon repressor/biotin-[acetyl-CoA-carboxylase] ligase